MENKHKIINKKDIILRECDTKDENEEKIKITNYHGKSDKNNLLDGNFLVTKNDKKIEKKPANNNEDLSKNDEKNGHSTIIISDTEDDLDFDSENKNDADNIIIDVGTNKDTVNECSRCGAILKHKSGLSRHKKFTCPKLNIKKDENIIDHTKIEVEKVTLQLKLSNEIEKNVKLEQLIKELKEDAEQKVLKIKEESENAIREIKKESEQKVKDLKKSVKELKATLTKERASKDLLTNNVLSQAGSVVKQSLNLNAIAYANKHYGDAPVLEKLEDTSILDEDDDDDDNDDLDAAEVYVLKYRNDTLIQHLASKVEKLYKKQDSKKQSLWAVDVSRTNYITRSKVNNKPEWVKDDKGNRVEQSVIMPLMKKLYKIINTHYLYVHKIYLTKSLTYDFPCPASEYVESVVSLMDDINKKRIGKQVIKEMSPSFRLPNREDKPVKKPKLLK